MVEIFCDKCKQGRVNFGVAEIKLSVINSKLCPTCKSNMYWIVMDSD